MKKRIPSSLLAKETTVLKKLKSSKADLDTEPSSQKDNAIFIFRRDLRVTDNTGLIACSRKYNVAPVFIFTPEQVKDNPFKSSNAIQFMIESLLDLQYSIDKLGGKLHTYFGDNIAVLEQLVTDNNVKAIYINKDYSPYSIKRDQRIRGFAAEQGIEFAEFNDLLLVDDVNGVTTNEGKFYYVFTHFYNRGQKLEKRDIDETDVDNWATLKPNKFAIKDFKDFCLKNGFYQENPNIAEKGGRKNGLLRLEGNAKSLQNYHVLKNFPASEEGSTRLSAHNKFGTISVRELYWYFYTTFGKDCDLIRQLYWRDFYYYLGFHYPEIYEGTPVPSKMHYSKINWGYDDIMFQKWCEGKTGFPIVDAGMREMNATGFMHNRVRMVVAMFLTKDIITNWKMGEKYFSNKLVDIDWALNLGNWIWCAGTGPDGSPWLRIFNPHSQTKKIDPECIYIKRWIPELKNVPAKAILEWNTEHANYKSTNYPAPMLDHNEKRLLALKAYGVKGKIKDDE